MLDAQILVLSGKRQKDGMVVPHLDSGVSCCSNIRVRIGRPASSVSAVSPVLSAVLTTDSDAADGKRRMMGAVRCSGINMRGREREREKEKASVIGATVHIG